MVILTARAALSSFGIRLGAASGGTFLIRKSPHCHSPLIFEKTLRLEGAALGYETKGGLLTRPLLLYGFNAIKVLSGANKQRPVPNGVRSQGSLLKIIFRNFEKILARLEHHALAFFALQIDFAVREHGRGGIIPAHALLPMHPPSPGIRAACDSRVRDHIKF